MVGPASFPASHQLPLSDPVSTPHSSQSARALAALLISDIINKRESLTRLLPAYQQRLSRNDDRRFLQALCFGTFRHYYWLEFILEQLLTNSLKNRDQDIQALLLLGLLQLARLRTPAHAAISATVSACDELTKPWAKKLVNAILRRYQRESEYLLNMSDIPLSARHDCPRWLLDRLQKTYPDQWETILAAGNCHPPMTLRINSRRTSREDYVTRLETAGIQATSLPFVTSALQLQQPMDVEELPGFYEGEVSVQDLAAQLASAVVMPKPGQRILDACAAPGGKLAHLLEQGVACREVVALESNPRRFEQLQTTLERLQLTATLKLADASKISDWWDRQPFDTILLDAPCTATGVIRRHPDIKVLRQAGDLEQVRTLQARLLDALWPLLKSGGKLVYVTCSLLSEENDQQVEMLLAQHPDARPVAIEADWGQTMKFGRQILPGEQGMDGFYYACIEKV